ncbi:hypothetical protein LDENG_00244220, partial [Lucifuga dentata]
SRLQLVQNAAARLLTGTHKPEHISPVISDLLQTYTPSRSLRSADQLSLVVPKAKLKTRDDGAFSVAAPKLERAAPPC